MNKPPAILRLLSIVVILYGVWTVTDNTAIQWTITIGLAITLGLITLTTDDK